MPSSNPPESRLAAIDIGSNSCLLAMARSDGAKVQLLSHRKEAIRLGSALDAQGALSLEAMQRGLPAMGSDIPVFREIGGPFMAYFDLDDPQNLVNLISEMETTGRFPAERNVSEWRWLGWREASAQLIERVMSHVHKPAVRVEKQHADCS